MEINEAAPIKRRNGIVKQRVFACSSRSLFPKPLNILLPLSFYASSWKWVRAAQVCVGTKYTRGRYSRPPIQPFGSRGTVDSIGGRLFQVVGFSFVIGDCSEWTFLSARTENELWPAQQSLSLLLRIKKKIEADINELEMALDHANKANAEAVKQVVWINSVHIHLWKQRKR